MKAIAVTPGTKNSAHLRDIPMVNVNDIPNGRGVLVKVLKVALDGTDRDIDKGEYGNGPEGDDYLVIGHEAFGIIVEIGANVTEFRVGDLVVPTVRRPGKSFYDTLGMQDLTADNTYYERGINLLHGYFTEYFVERPEFLVAVPDEFEQLGVMVEPISIVEKGWEHIMDIQRRMGIWRPRTAAVLGAGPLGMLAAWKLRLEGLQTHVFSLEQRPHMKADLLDEIHAQYHSTKEVSIQEAAEKFGPFDIVFECTGYAPMMAEAAHIVAKNGVVCLTSVTPKPMMVETNLSEINMDFVLGNKVMFGTVNASYQHFSLSVRDLGFGMHMYTGWMEKFITHELDGLDQFERALYLLNNSWQENALKIVINVAQK
jgi:threonine dehydrogenase-like Zn-dependent dehydrogenase